MSGGKIISLSPLGQHATEGSAPLSFSKTHEWSGFKEIWKDILQNYMCVVPMSNLSAVGVYNIASELRKAAAMKEQNIIDY